MATGYISQFIAGNTIGSIVQAPYNLSDVNYLKADGSIITRANYPIYSAQSGSVGTFTTTIRAAMASSLSGATNSMSSNGTNMVVSTGQPALLGIQFSTNGGVTWSNATSGLVASASFIQTAFAGTNFIGVSNTTNSQMVYAAASSPGVWTASSGVTLANGNTPTIAANSAGTVVLMYGTGAYVSTNSGVSYTATSGVTGSTVSPPIVWTGTQFMVMGIGGTGIGTQTSPTGLTGTWTVNAIAPWGASYTPSSAVSDGAGNVLVTANANSVAWVSNNGGTTWREVMLPQPASGQSSYANGRFFTPQTLYSSASGFTADGSVAVSSDLLTWVSVPNFALTAGTGSSTISTTLIGYAQGNYAAVNNISPGYVYTSTENTAQMYLPTSRRNYGFTTNWQEWVKVQ